MFDSSSVKFKIYVFFNKLCFITSQRSLSAWFAGKQHVCNNIELLSSHKVAGLSQYVLTALYCPVALMQKRPDKHRITGDKRDLIET